MINEIRARNRSSLEANTTSHPVSPDGKFLVTMRYKRGRHADVYEDFENDFLRNTGWKSLKGSLNALEYLFEKCFLPRLRYRTFPFDLPFPRRDRIYFSSLSGIEYIKIFQHYACRAKLKVIYQFDSWTHDNAINENAFRSFKIDIAFLSIRKAVEYFNSLQIPFFRAYWIPEAITLGSYRQSDYAEKDIDFLQYGRRWDWIHERLLPFCASKGLRYEHPLNCSTDKSQFKTRAELLTTLARTKTAICVPKTVTHPEIYDLPTVTTRYFECMASKCLILGHAPEDLINLFGYNPVVEADNSDPMRQLEYLRDHYQEFLPLIEKNYRITQEKHQWRNRIVDMIDIIDDSLACKAPA